MNLTHFPRRRYVEDATPIQKLSRLSHLLGGPEIYIKRDDLLDLAGGGSKTRKLDFLVADALAQGANVLITGGAVQSNHCRLTLAASAREGLRCRLVLEERISGSYQTDGNGNIFLMQLLGAETIHTVPGGTDMTAEMARMAEEAQAEGHRPYVIPVGGSNAVGDVGYAACSFEILSQSFHDGIGIDTVLCASGSGGTQAGLIAGFAGCHSAISVVGINVVRGREAQEDLVGRLARETASHLGIPTEILRGSVRCFDDYLGDGYSLPTDDMIAAVSLLAKTEGILLDPCYTGKAMAGLIDLIRQRHFPANQRILFLHTGGIPALYAHHRWFI